MLRARSGHPFHQAGQDVIKAFRSDVGPRVLRGRREVARDLAQRRVGRESARERLQESLVIVVRTEDRVRGNIRNALEAVHQSTARSVHDWLSKITHEVGAWARSPLVRDVVMSPGTGRKGGELLTPLSSLPSFAGYLALDPAGRIVISDDRSLPTRTVSLELGSSPCSSGRRLPVPGSRGICRSRRS